MRDWMFLRRELVYVYTSSRDGDRKHDSTHAEAMEAVALKRARRRDKKTTFQA